MPRGNPAFKKGKPNPYGKPPAGRPPGVPNKITTYKQAAEESFRMVGGEEYLHRIAKEEPAAYLAFIGRFIPKQMEIDLNVNDLRERLERARRRLIEGSTDQPD